MRLTFKHFDGRRMNRVPVVDEETGEKVGFIHSEGVGFSGSGGIEVSLFDGKYTMTVDTYDQCWGFVKGVEVVLRHMTSLRKAGVSDAVSDAA